MYDKIVIEKPENKRKKNNVIKEILHKSPSKKLFIFEGHPHSQV